MKIIALGRQGKLAYVLSENLHESKEELSKAATEAMVALARWVAIETRKLQRGAGNEDRGSRMEDSEDAGGSTSIPSNPLSTSYDELMYQRPEIEAAVARAMDVHRGRHGQDLLRAGLLLADWPGSKTLAILQTAKHGGQAAMVRRLQQPPASEHVEAFLLGATHGQLRSHFGIAFAHVEQSPVLDALLRKTHWLKEHQLQVCMHYVTRGVWWGETELTRDLERRTPDDAAKIGEWIAVSGCHDVLQDERLEKVREYVMRGVDARQSASPAPAAQSPSPGTPGEGGGGGLASEASRLNPPPNPPEYRGRETASSGVTGVAESNSFPARLRLLRIACRRKRGASVALLRKFLEDPDERLLRMAAREIVRRRPPDFENMLLQLMTAAPISVRRVISRSIGQAGFEHYWNKFDRLAKPVRKQAGKAMLKLLPDAIHRLSRRLFMGPAEQQIKAMQMVQELDLGEQLRAEILSLCHDGNPRLRSKAVAVAGTIASIGSELLVGQMLNDSDSRVRANTIEVLESRNDPSLVPVLAERARAAGAGNRERANAIKAMSRMRVSTVAAQLSGMLRDERAEHRISGLWALRQIGWWQLLSDVGRLAKEDGNMRVRRYALGILRGVAEMAEQRHKSQPPRDVPRELPGDLPKAG
jgi:HEAT repeat protein